MEPDPQTCCAQTLPAHWMDLLRSQGGRVTRSRQRVLEAMAQLGRPSTAQEIARSLGRRACNLATVYRSIALFENMGLVRRVELGDGQTRFELAGDDQHTHHHHHLFCKRCGRILKVEGCELSRFEASLARDHGYTEIEHRLEFFGICPRCQSTRTAGSPQHSPGTMVRPDRRRPAQ
ncbi:transcriptional repressor [Limisphaera ngatamarikiensis]|uniref:Transcriptional repressor n=1 Tax=Limisphaera ngatamarikiensis TaxID=1324935 RepID=A0A6M1RKK5_9BACT|nr:transcriptional repressor [Limisphaera ngatamarikiensis]NGO40588.1 transcriptional repressor [Limisphaera ngatamarikiensis]